MSSQSNVIKITEEINRIVVSDVGIQGPIGPVGPAGTGAGIKSISGLVSTLNITAGDGERNRVLTLNNNKMTVFVMIYKSGFKVMPSQYSVVHNITNTEITFSGIDVFDDDELEVVYFEY